MSIKKLQLSFLLVIGLGFGIHRYFLLAHQPAPRTFAPQSPPFNVSQYSSRGVVDRIIQLKIETFAVRKSNSTDLTKIVAFVSMPFDFDGPLQYKWTLGQNVYLIEGALEGVSQKGFQKETPQQIALVVQGFDKKQLRHIGFEAWANKNGRRLYTDGLISSQKENSFEDVVQHVEKLKAEKTGLHK